MKPDFEDTSTDDPRQTIVDVPMLCHEPHASGLTCEAMKGKCFDGSWMHYAMVGELQVVWSHEYDRLEVINDETPGPAREMFLIWSEGQFAKKGRQA